MPACSVCGNEISASEGRCPFCGSSENHVPPRQRIVTINLKINHPTVSEALAKLEREVAAARQRGTRQVRLIHGYGSTGSGGAIRDAVRGLLRRWQQQNRIRGYQTGESLSDKDTQSGHRSDLGNPGITIVDL